MAKAVLLAILIAGALSCAPEVAPAPVNPEIAARAAFDGKAIVLTGFVLDSTGQPFEGATVLIQDQEAVTDASGRYVIRGLQRVTSLMEVDAQGHYRESRTVNLHTPSDINETTTTDIRITPRAPGESRFFFGGDVSMGRRYFSQDPQVDVLPPDDPETLILPSMADSSSREVLASIKPIIEAADFASINLETVVTNTPNTPFEGKKYVFYTLPGSLDALKWAGVDYMAIGNNHLYDYLDEGVTETRDNLSMRQIPFSGAGRSPVEAFLPHRETIAGENYAMISACTLTGTQYDTSLVAEIGKAGVANAWDDERLAGAIQRAVEAGRHPIVNLHTGSEYSESPSEAAHERMLFAAQSGATAVIAHHPHVAQGFEFYNDTLIAHSLGNLVFDQKRHETVLGLGIYVDMRAGKPVRVQGVPVYIEDYVPRPVIGSVSDVFLRRIAETSANFGTTVGIEGGRAFVATEETEIVQNSREVSIRLNIDESGVGYIDLRQFGESDESVTSLRAMGLQGELGRDILTFGDMEDVDADSDESENQRWFFNGTSTGPCLHDTNRGTLAMCSWLEADDRQSTMSFRNRVRVVGNDLDKPNKDMTFVGYFSGQNAGTVTVSSQYYASMGDREYNRQRLFSEDFKGTKRWAPIWKDLDIPEDDPNNPESRTDNARAMRLFIDHSPPLEGAALFRMDDLALVTWMPHTGFIDKFEIEHHHPHDFVRLRGEPGSSHVVKVTLSRFVQR